MNTEDSEFERIEAEAKMRVEQQAEPTPWRDMVVVSLVREGTDKHRARELADHFAAQRPWQGLTKEDQFEIAEKLGLFGVAWLDLMRVIEARLKELNK